MKTRTKYKIRRILSVTAFALAGFPSLGGALAAQDSLTFVRADWQETELAEGVVWRSHNFRNDETLFGAPQNINVLEIVQDKADVRFVLGYYPGQIRRTSDMAYAANALAAVNGTYYSTEPPYGPTGYFQKDGQVVNSLMAATGNVAVIDSRGRLALERLKNDPDSLDRYPTVVAGAPLLVWNGKEQIGPEDSTLAPRTAVGTSGNTVWLVTVDGRSSRAAGMSPYQLACIFRWLGAEKALNLDGGGSTTMYVRCASAAGVVNEPSDNFLGIFRGLERRVGSALLLLPHEGLCSKEK